MLNLYALRSTDPLGLWLAGGRSPDTPAEGELIPGNGPGFDENLYAILRALLDAERVVCAWGANPGPDPGRPAFISQFLVLTRSWCPAVALALTKHGQPRHPLYVKGDVTPLPYPPTTEDQ